MRRHLQGGPTAAGALGKAAETRWAAAREHGKTLAGFVAARSAGAACHPYAGRPPVVGKLQSDSTRLGSEGGSRVRIMSETAVPPSPHPYPCCGFLVFADLPDLLLGG